MARSFSNFHFLETNACPQYLGSATQVLFFSAQNIRPHVLNPLLLLRGRPKEFATRPRFPRVQIRDGKRQLTEKLQLLQVGEAGEEGVFFFRHRRRFSDLVRASTVPDRLVDADVEAAQVAETSDGGAEGAVPFFLLGLVVRGHVQVEASYGERV